MRPSHGIGNASLLVTHGWGLSVVTPPVHVEEIIVGINRLLILFGIEKSAEEVGYSRGAEIVSIDNLKIQMGIENLLIVRKI